MRDTTRRSFFKSVGLGTAALAVSPPVLAALPAYDTKAVDDKKGGKIAFGLVTYQWAKDWDLPTLIANCEKTKTLGVELRTTHRHGVESSLSKEQRAEVKGRFADSPVNLVGLGSNERFDDPDPAKLAKAIATTKEFVRTSHDVGGAGVKVKPNSFHEGVAKEKTLEQIGKALRQLAEFGEGFGQEIRLEVHGQCSELPYIQKILEIAAHRNAKVCWNSNASDLAGKGLEHNFGLVSKYFGRTAHIRHLETKDEYPLDKLFELFVAMDYEGWIMLEDGRVPKDPVRALGRNRTIFERKIAAARLRA